MPTKHNRPAQHSTTRCWCSSTTSAAVLFVVLAAIIAAAVGGIFAATIIVAVSAAKSLFTTGTIWLQHGAVATAAAVALTMILVGWRIAWDITIRATQASAE